MLKPATLIVADRLTAILMALIEAVCPAAITGSVPTFPGPDAQILFHRLTRFVTTLIRFCAVGIPARAKPAATEARTNPALVAERRSPAQRLPTRPGWLLDALPDIAPAIAADLAALLADPALAPLFAAAPSLYRTLRPLLRSLGLAQYTPSPSPPPSGAPPSHPGPSRTNPIDHPLGRPAVSQPTVSDRACKPNASARPTRYDIATITT